MRPTHPRAAPAAPTFDPAADAPARVGVVGAQGAGLDALVAALHAAGLHPFRVPLDDTGSFLSLSQEGALEPARLVVVLANTDSWALHCRALAWLGGPAGPDTLLVVAATEAAAHAVGLPARVLVDAPEAEAAAVVAEMLAARGFSASALTPVADTRSAETDEGLDPLPTYRAGDRVGRYVLGRRLGAGGMGVVFEAEDTEHGQRVALKLLLRRGRGAVDRMKREFRLASTLTHPNLLPLYELAQDGATWFFTMKQVDGQHLDIALRQAGLDATGVARAFRQLVAALRTMHRAGLVHLDVKPSNVLVDPHGRLFLLDYGIARRFDGEAHVHAGTPRYMAPEVIRGAIADPVCDWYSVGATLHHVLTGGPPLPEGPDGDLHAAGPLGRLCLDLLAPDPADRPDFRDIVARLGGPAPADTNPARPTAAPVVLGREAELRWLAARAAEARAGQPVVVAVTGPSGIGKSALVRHFMEELEVGSGAVALRGRCFERESIPFQALDGVIDDLRRYLELSFLGWDPLVKGASRDLSRLFPGFDGKPDPPDAIAESHVRARAQEALGELLSRPARTAPLVLVIDDVQWGDADSGRLLAAALRGRPMLPLLVLVTSRTHTADSPFLSELAETTRVAPLALEPLDAVAAAEVLRQAVGGDVDPAVLRAAIDEADGNPWLLTALGLAARGPAAPRVADLVHRRLDALSPQERRLLEVAAVAARPTPLAAVLDAAAVDVDVAGALSHLANLQLLRARGFRRSDTVECFHDRIRQVVEADLPAERRRTAHAGLARALSDADAAPALVARHHHGAGEIPEAIALSRRAARDAGATRAHLQAARMWAQAADWADEIGAPSRDDRISRARSLALAGHRVQAAEGLLALQGGPLDIDLQLEAAEHLLASGEVGRGTAELGPLLIAHRIRPPRSAVGLGLSAAWTLLWLALTDRGRPAARVRAALADRAAVCRAAAKGLLATDTLRGLWFAVKGLSWALRSGEEAEAVRALAVVGSVVLLPLGGFMGRWGERMLARAERRATERADPLLMGVVAVGRAQERLLAGDWSSSREWAGRAETWLSGSGRDVAWERDIARLATIRASYELGRWEEAEALARRLRDTAVEHGDLYGEVVGATYLSDARLAAGDVDEARALAKGVRSRWPFDGVHMQHVYVERTLATCALMGGDAAAARDRIEALWPGLARSGLLNVPLVHFDMWELRGRLALATGADPAAAAAALARQPTPHSQAQARLLGALHQGTSDPQAAAAALDPVATAFDGHGMRSRASAVRRAASRLRADPGGVRIAEEALATHGVAAPQAWADGQAPIPPSPRP